MGGVCYVTAGPKSGGAKLLYHFKVRGKDSELVKIVSLFRDSLSSAVHEYIDRELASSNADTEAWLRWCAPAVKQMYVGR